MGMDVGPYLSIREAQGPRAYEVRSGRRWLQSLEPGDLRCWPEYHLILIDERTGLITIEGGYGTFCYGWSKAGRGEESLHSFLYDLNFDYFMGKASKQDHRVADIGRTLGKLRRRLLERRRYGEVDRGQARRMWEFLDEVNTNSAEFLVADLWNDPDWCDDATDCLVYIDHPGMRRFWDEVWKPFCEEVLRQHWLDHLKRTPLPSRRALVAVAA